MKHLFMFRNSSAVARGLALVLMLASFSVSAQGVLSSTNTQTGTIQVEAQDDGYLTISGQNYTFSSELSLVFLNGEEVGDQALDEGLVVRYTLNRDGVLTRIEILGPINLIQSLEPS